MKRNAIVGPNPIHPNYLTAEERIDELGRILAQGLLRLHEKGHPDPHPLIPGARTTTTAGSKKVKLKTPVHPTTDNPVA